MQGRPREEYFRLSVPGYIVWFISMLPGSPRKSLREGQQEVTQELPGKIWAETPQIVNARRLQGWSWTRETCKHNAVSAHFALATSAILNTSLEFIYLTRTFPISSSSSSFSSSTAPVPFWHTSPSVFPWVQYVNPNTTVRHRPYKKVHYSDLSSLDTYPL